MEEVTDYRFSCGPWCFDPGRDAFGSPVRAAYDLDEVLDLLCQLGYRGIELHDDDVVPAIDDASQASIAKRAGELKKRLEDKGLKTAFVAPRLWEDQRTVDGAVTANDPAMREYAFTRWKKAIDVAHVLETPNLVFFLGREGTYTRESKDPQASVGLIVEHMNRVLEYDITIRILGETKPNEPLDQIYCPTVGHFVGIAYKTIAPERVGISIETAHCAMMGTDPVDDIGYALWHEKLWGLHLDDQNGAKFNQHRTFGAINIRQALNIVSLLDRNRFFDSGFVGIETRPLRTQSRDKAVSHLAHSRRIFLALAAISRSMDEQHLAAFKAAKDYEGQEMYILERLCRF